MPPPRFAGVEVRIGRGSGCHFCPQPRLQTLGRWVPEKSNRRKLGNRRERSILGVECQREREEGRSEGEARRRQGGGGGGGESLQGMEWQGAIWWRT